MERFLKEKIETVRSQMILVALDQDQLTNEKVVTLSEELDRYIIFYQRIQKQASNVTSKLPYVVFNKAT